MSHRLVLPLPQAFSSSTTTTSHGSGNSTGHNGSTGGGEYTTFTHHNSRVDGLHPQLQAYLQRLSIFLRKTRLIQYHPDNFFHFLLNTNTDGNGAPAPLFHLDGTVVQREEVEYMRDLCNALATLIPNEDTLIDQLHLLIRDGPPPGAASCLQSFFEETKALQLHRRPQSQNKSASETLRVEEDGPPPHSDVMEEQRRQRVMDAVRGYGMGPKKQHEVTVMRETVLGLVNCCNAGDPSLEPVDTVMNIGEGKGYVSRALALCDGLQVIGLDCNPSHKERAAERVKHLLHGRLGLDAAASDRRGRDILNLMYEPRGYMASVACSVSGSDMNWADVLRGHVRLCDSTSPVDAMVGASTQSGGVRDESPLINTTAAAVKLQCRVCHHIVRREATAVILRHALRHVHSEPIMGGAGLPSKATVDAWNRELSVGAFTERIMTAFFTDAISYVSEADMDTFNLTKRLRSQNDGTASSANDNDDDEDEEDETTCNNNNRENNNNNNNNSNNNAVGGEMGALLRNYELFTSTRVPRGVRAQVLVPVRQNTEKESKNVEDMPVEGDERISEIDYLYVKTCLTVIGYDCAPNRHFVILDDGRQKEAFMLLQHREDRMSLEEKNVEELNIPPAQIAWMLKLAILLHVIPPVAVKMPIVHVPDLRNTVMMGLHPCGNLGSSVCQLFTSSKSRGLVLVSCCWHALTNDGFPLSHELRSSGWCTEQISLLLATQPLDMWATISASGHRSSARVLFYRSLLKLLWYRIRDEWQNVRVAREYCCSFAAVPHLEPAFLRRVAKIKDTISLQKLYTEVCQEYFSTETVTETNRTIIKEKPHQQEGEGEVCAFCRPAQVEFLRSASHMALAAQMDEVYVSGHFTSFLGLTLLRMWMCHLVETLLLLDRVLYLTESLQEDTHCSGSIVSLVPLFNGALSPRMFGILARRIPVRSM